MSRAVSIGGITWTQRARRGRAFWVPDRLPILTLSTATRKVELHLDLGPQDVLDVRIDLADVRERDRAYALLLEHGTPWQISACVHAPFLIRAWPTLAVTRVTARPWQAVINGHVDPRLAG